jgi:CheY-like chemotaxis protein
VATILLVEDDPDIRETLSEILHGERYTVLTAAHGREGLTLLSALRVLPDLILLDLRMPVMDGREFRGVLLAHPEWRAIPVVVYSGTPDFCPPEDLEPLAANLVKPVEIPVLLAVLARYCGPRATAPHAGLSAGDGELDEELLFAAC